MSENEVAAWRGMDPGGETDGEEANREPLVVPTSPAGSGHGRTFLQRGHNVAFYVW